MNTTTLTTGLQTTITGFVQLVSPLTPEQLNRIPFRGSWTAAQVAEHVYKSNTSIIAALTEKGTIAGREADTRVKELKDTFLNFELKFKSGAAITPAEGDYEKELLLTRLEESFDRVVKLSETVNPEEIIVHRALGEITKLELLHFVIYHTQRHTHQLRNIIHTIQAKNTYAP